jgi:hypothetical protein
MRAVPSSFPARPFLVRLAFTRAELPPPPCVMVSVASSWGLTVLPPPKWGPPDGTSRRPLSETHLASTGLTFDVRRLLQGSSKTAPPPCLGVVSSPTHCRQHASAPRCQPGRMGRPRGFSPPRRVPPPHRLRACCISLPAMGFIGLPRCLLPQTSLSRRCFVLQSVSLPSSRASRHRRPLPSRRSPGASWLDLKALLHL